MNFNNAVDNVENELKGIPFEDALHQCKSGKGMRLKNWKDDVVIRAQYPDEL